MPANVEPSTVALPQSRVSPPFDSVHQQQQPDDRDQHPHGIEAAGSGHAFRAQARGCPRQAEHDDRHVDQEDRAPPEVLEQQPPSDRPIAIAAPTAPAQIPMARPRSAGGKITAMIASVTGITAAAPMPISARYTISCSATGVGAQRGGQAEQEQADHQNTFAPVPVTQQAPGEQQGGEHQDVGVDRPVELALRARTG